MTSLLWSYNIPVYYAHGSNIIVFLQPHIITEKKTTKTTKIMQFFLYIFLNNHHMHAHATQKVNNNIKKPTEEGKKIRKTIKFFQ